MKRWAVGYIDFSSNDLRIEIVQAETWLDALWMHTDTAPVDGSEWKQDINALWPDVELIKQEFFNCDSMIDVVAIEDSLEASIQPERLTNS